MSAILRMSYLRLLTFGRQAFGVFAAHLLPLVILAATAEVRPAYGADVKVLAVGANRSFDDELPQLRYAERDAERFSMTMSAFGESGQKDVKHLRAPTLAELRSLLHTYGRQMDESTKKFIFYFSGHADDQHLHLQDGPLAKVDFWRLVAQIPVKTKIVILDGCFTGAFLKKGLKKAPQFELPKYEVDEPSGSVFLSATSSSRQAFESDTIQGGLFTHNLVAALEGAADNNRDGMVTLWEAYDYTYRNTKLASLTIPGDNLQRPEFSAKLSGAGSIAMTYPRLELGELKMAPELVGRIRIAAVSGRSHFSFKKIPGQEKSLTLPVGRYQVAMSRGKDVGFAVAEINRQGGVFLKDDDFLWASRRLPALAKGPGVGSGNGNGNGPSPQGLAVTNTGLSEPDHWRGYLGLGRSRHFRDIGLQFLGLTNFGGSINHGILLTAQGLSPGDGQRFGGYFVTRLGGPNLSLDFGLGVRLSSYYDEEGGTGSDNRHFTNGDSFLGFNFGWQSFGFFARRFQVLDARSLKGDIRDEAVVGVTFAVGN